MLRLLQESLGFIGGILFSEYCMGLALLIGVLVAIEISLSAGILVFLIPLTLLLMMFSFLTFHSEKIKEIEEEYASKLNNAESKVDTIDDL